MAIVPQRKREKVRNLLELVENEIHKANEDLLNERLDKAEYTASYKSGLDGSAKTHVKNSIKALLWLKNNLGITGNITAFTDTQIRKNTVDVIDFDDGDG